MVPATAISTAIRSAASFPGGNSWPLLCDAIGNALSTWTVVPGNVAIQGVTAGVAGAGSVFGSMRFTGVTPLVIGAMQGGGLTGKTVSLVGTAISIGVSSSLTGSFRYRGVSAGVGQGTDISLVTLTNVPTLVVALRSAHAASCASRGGSGSTTPTLYTSIAAGIAAILATGTTIPGTGIVTPTGVLGPSAGAGTSISFVV